MYIISKKFTFSAAHRLMDLPKTHPCTQVHGHNYTVTCHFKSKDLNLSGMVIDYKDMDKIKEYLNDKYDHKFLNNEMFLTPTAENLAKRIYDYVKGEFPQLYSVTVSETEKTNAVYYED